MGKFEDEQSLSSSGGVVISIPDENVDSNRCQILSTFVRLRCVIALLLGVAVFLSAIFWLPPFLGYRDRTDLDPNALYRGHDVVARFKLRKPVSLLKANIPKLEYDIFEEISFVNYTVVVISLEPSAGSNSTDVVFAVEPYPKYSEISSASLSLLRASFVSLIIRQSSLHLTPSLFGDPFSFEVLKFRGGITVIPPQNVFLLQKVQILFNFTLNFSVHEIQENFNELKDQLKSGLHLNPVENLYVSLTNSYGSTVASPTTVEASVLLTIGNLPPSLPRLKQLAQTITGSHAKNLGLDHSVFGKVKQVRLSSFLQHSLNSSGSSVTPSPAPLPHPSARHHHHHHHHHHHQPPPQYPHLHDVTPTPAPAPAPDESHQTKPPSGCQIGFNGKAKRHESHDHLAPTVSPAISPGHYAASPHPHVHPPTPASNLLPPSSPLPALVPLAPIYPPSDNKPDVESHDITPSVAPLASSFAAGRLPSVMWSFALLLPLVAHLIW